MRPASGRVGDGVAVEDGEDRQKLGDIVALDGRVDGLELRIVAAAEEREGRRQRARRDAGDEAELRPVAPFRPSVEKTGPEGAVLAATGDGEQVLGARCAGHLTPAFGGRIHGGERRRIARQGKAGIGNAEEGGLRRLVARHRRQARLRRTPGERKRRRHRDQLKQAGDRQSHEPLRGSSISVCPCPV